jgi:N-acetylglucosaminyldiphosphoundecaprenol N-acetyl-beta-D-mannosaminyltransferase
MGLIFSCPALPEGHAMLNNDTANPPDWRRRWSLLLEKIERVQDPAEGQALLAELSHPPYAFGAGLCQCHAMNSMAVSAPFFEAMHSADRVLRDGSGMATLFKLLRMEPGLNLNGTDFIPRLIRAFDGRSIALFGTREPYLEKAWQCVRQDLAPHSTVIRANGFLDAEAYAASRQNTSRR